MAECLERRTFLSAGDPDLTFGHDGIVRPETGGPLEGAAVAVQADGKVLVAGTVTHSNGGSDFFVTRYNPNGTPDTDGPSLPARSTAISLWRGSTRTVRSTARSAVTALRAPTWAARWRSRRR